MPGLSADGGSSSREGETLTNQRGREGGLPGSSLEDHPPTFSKKATSKADLRRARLGRRWRATLWLCCSRVPPVELGPRSPGTAPMLKYLRRLWGFSAFEGTPNPSVLELGTTIYPGRGPRAHGHRRKQERWSVYRPISHVVVMLPSPALPITSGDLYIFSLPRRPSSSFSCLSRSSLSHRWPFYAVELLSPILDRASRDHPPHSPPIVHPLAHRRLIHLEACLYRPTIDTKPAIIEYRPLADDEGLP